MKSNPSITAQHAARFEHNQVGMLAWALMAHPFPNMVGGVPGQPGPDSPNEQPSEPGEPTLPDQPPPAPVA
ncbi:hypothetical protein SFA35_20835 [Pseudomonas sp. HR96]|uniref:hypothetical protein n=1 Tax=Pseudomonas sp. HR96 TaxID=1027966 RepID=UPI002A757DC5|nr:hypothetical protein [Pseudomonas sp. HR96]WPO99033.1 hypothetical protein SFA35_20835 [Pseudomonas sp. HR96]